MRFPQLIQIFSTVCLMMCSHLTIAKTVPHLGEVKKNITAPEGQAFYAEQMSGIPRQSPFGQMPEHIDIQSFIQWLAPHEDIKFLTTSGAKKWGNDGLYVGVVCFARDIRNVAEFSARGDTTCDSSYVGSSWQLNKLYIGVFRINEQGFIPIAKTKTYIQLTGFDRDGNERDPDSYNKLDLAPYRITDDKMALGLRTGFQVGYSGGGAYTEYLQLFMIQEDQVVNILNEPVYEFADLAGNWNKDGTREHHLSESKSTVHMLKNKTDGFYDIELRTGKHRTKFIWSSKAGRYLPKK